MVPLTLSCSPPLLSSDTETRTPFRFLWDSSAAVLCTPRKADVTVLTRSTPPLAHESALSSYEAGVFTSKTRVQGHGLAGVRPLPLGTGGLSRDWVGGGGEGGEGVWDAETK